MYDVLYRQWPATLGNAKWTGPQFEYRQSAVGIQEQEGRNQTIPQILYHFPLLGPNRNIPMYRGIIFQILTNTWLAASTIRPFAQD